MDKYTKNVPLVFKRKVPMEHYHKGTIWGIICGMSAGMSKFIFFLQASTPFPQKLLEAAITAAICGLAGGVAGGAGKWLWNWFRNWLKSKFIKH
jgi:hypothetical protein